MFHMMYSSEQFFLDVGHPEHIFVAFRSHTRVLFERYSVVLGLNVFAALIVIAGQTIHGSLTPTKTVAVVEASRRIALYKRALREAVISRRR